MLFFLGWSRRHQPCHFRKRATSALAEGPVACSRKAHVWCRLSWRCYLPTPFCRVSCKHRSGWRFLYLCCFNTDNNDNSNNDTTTTTNNNDNNNHGNNSNNNDDINNMIIVILIWTLPTPALAYLFLSLSLYIHTHIYKQIKIKK